MVIIENTKYIQADDIIASCPIWCKGIRNGRELIKKKEISTKYFIYARYGDARWITTDGKSVKYDKVFIRKKYMDTCDEYNKEINKVNIKDDCEKVPDLIILDDDEKMHDDDGNIIEIETRGTRQYDKMYFKVKDISDRFEIKNLSYILLNENIYLINRDYKYFSYMNDKIFNEKPTKKNVSKELFLTYIGLLRVILVSKLGKTEKVIEWMTKTLFMAQLGTREQKEEVSSKLLGVSTNVIKEVFKTSATSIPCIYLFTLGSVRELRQIMTIDKKYSDNSLVCKYGYTGDLAEITNEYSKTYGDIKNVDMKLKYCSYIDPMYISDAESDIQDFFMAINARCCYEKYGELIIISPDLSKIVEKQYKQISHFYGGHIKDLIKENEDLKRKLDISMLNKNNELLCKDKEILMLINEKEILNKNNELLKKDLEIEKLKNKIFDMEARKK